MSVRLSRLLSWLLRHGAEKEGFQFLPGGYLYIDEILKQPQFSTFSIHDVDCVVSTSNKIRFHIDKEPESGRLKIRANQGHSLKVSDLDLEPIIDASLFPVVTHGTYYKCWLSICEQGLKRMKRNHVHFAIGEPGDQVVVSGMRQTSEIIIYLNLANAMQGGLNFFCSANNVILTAGDDRGVVSQRFFHQVIDRKTGKRIKIVR